MKNSSQFARLGLLGGLMALDGSHFARAHWRGEARYYPGWSRSAFDPRINRHTGRPHEHKREKARRARQAARAAQ